MKLKQVLAGVLMAVLAVGSLAAKAEIAAESNEGFLDLTIGDRAAKDTEALVVDPAWGDADAAELLIDGESGARQFSVAGVDAWETASLEPGRYVVALKAGELVEQAAFWKLGEDWVVLDSETITENVTFESGKTYLVFGTNLIASGVTLTVTDGAKFFYDESAPAGFQTAGGSLNELPKRYKIADGLDPADETKFYQIVEKIHGCEDNPWAIGAEGEVVAWTNGTELVVAGAGTIGALDENAELAALLDGLTGLTIVDAGVTAGADAFAALAGDASVALTLPDGWQGEFPDEDGNWYGAMVELTALPLTVRDVTFQQRWPWNGMVDVTFNLTGPEGARKVVVTAFTNGTEQVASFVATVAIPKDGVAKGARVVWNAAAADLDANFRSSDIAIEVAIAETESAIAAVSAAGKVDLRTRIALAEGETTVANVRWSATAWGELVESFTTVGYTNLTTGATGEFGNLADIMGEGAKDIVLPQKDGDYMFTHTQGDFVSFATFTVTGYPLGGVANPWEIGAGGDSAAVTAVREGNGVVIDPVRGEVTREGLETIVDALGGTEFPVGLVSSDGTSTDELVLLVGSDGKGFRSLADALASDSESFTLYEIPGPTVTLPAGIEGMTLVVSNLTDGVEIPVASSIPGGADYVLPYGAEIAVYAVPAENYELVDGVNPIKIDEVLFETTVDIGALPTAANLTAAKEEAELAAAKADAVAEIQAAAGPEEERSAALESLVEAERAEIMAAESQEALSAVLDDALAAIAVQLAADAKSKVEKLYPEGDGAFVAPKKATQYLGSFVTADGVVNGTVVVKMTKPSKRTGQANIAATITTLDRKTLVFKATKVDVAGSTDGAFVLAPVNVRARAMGNLSIVIGGDSLTGTLANGQGVDAARNVFKERKDPKRARIAPFVGNWTLALSVDGELLPLTMRVANSGSVRLSGKFASGKTFSAGVNAVVGDNWICAPVTVVKASDGRKVEVAFAVAFRETTGIIEIVRSANIELVAVGTPASDKKSIKTKTVSIEGFRAPDRQSVNYAANSGKITGSAMWKVGSKSVKAKLFGVEIGGVVYGNAVIDKAARPFTLQ